MMAGSKWPAIAGLAALATAVWAAAGTLAEARTGSELRLLFGGSRLYTSELPGTSERNDLWHFAADGAVIANYAIWIHRSFEDTEVHETEHGRWRIVDATLCLNFRYIFEGDERCYRIEDASGNEYGAHMFRAIDVAGGDSWRFALAR